MTQLVDEHIHHLRLYNFIVVIFGRKKNETFDFDIRQSVGEGENNRG